MTKAIIKKFIQILIDLLGHCGSSFILNHISPSFSSLFISHITDTGMSYENLDN